MWELKYLRFLKFLVVFHFAEKLYYLKWFDNVTFNIQSNRSIEAAVEIKQKFMIMHQKNKNNFYDISKEMRTPLMYLNDVYYAEQNWNAAK